MRNVDLALYADLLAGEASSLAARVEREHGKLRQAAIERAARNALTPVAVERLEELGLLKTRGDPHALADLEEALDAVEALQAWVEEALAATAVDAASTDPDSRSASRVRTLRSTAAPRAAPPPAAQARPP